MRYSLGHSRRRTASLATVAAAVAATALLTGDAVPAGAQNPTAMTPIGGGYELESLQGFSLASADGASGPTVDLVVVPASYGDAPEDRAENLRLAQQRTDQIDRACDAVVKAPITGCTAVLAPVLQRSDALDPANAALITEQIDGIYILGGDQGLAMQVMANSPFETAMNQAFARGANVGGTSAGAAVESTSMLNGYTGDLNPWDGLQRNSSLMWWGDDGDAERGLALGSKKIIYDQHFYQRGRFGRLLSTIATSDERFGRKSLLGVGVDYATGVRNTDDATLSGVFGPSSVAVLDFETLGATPRWVGPASLLSVRNVVTHLMTKGNTSLAIDARRLTVDGKTVAAPKPKAWSAPKAPGRSTLYLGGDVSGDFTQGVMPDFVKTALASPRGAKGSILVYWSGAASEQKAANAYVKGLAAAGWTGKVELVARGTTSRIAPASAAGVVLLGYDPEQVPASLADRTFSAQLQLAVLTAPVVLADRHMASALGTWYSPKADPTSDNYEDEGIANFITNDGNWQRGLGLVDAAVVPSLTYDYRWGRLFDLGQKVPGSVSFGIGEETAIKLVNGKGATVVGTGSVVAGDPRSGQFWTGSNGAIGAANMLLSTFAPGEKLTSG